MSEPASQPASPVRCCFCGGEIAHHPDGDAVDEVARMGFLDFAPGDEAAAFLAREQSFTCHVACFRARLHDPTELRPFEAWPGLADETAALDACGELTSDLFLRPDTLPFRERLFGQEPGRWLSVAKLCAGIEHAERRLAEIAERADLVLLVQHTPHPADSSGEYALVIFTEPYQLWTTSITHLRGV